MVRVEPSSKCSPSLVAILLAIRRMEAAMVAVARQRAAPFLRAPFLGYKFVRLSGVHYDEQGVSPMVDVDRLTKFA